MPIFRSKQAEDIDAVAAKLADARRSLAVAESELAERAVEFVLADDAVGLAEINGRVAAARDRVYLLVLAHKQAVDREAARLAEARLKARRSEQRAAAQHAGRIAAGAERYERAVKEMAAAFAEMVAGGEAFSKLLSYPHQNEFPDFSTAGLTRAGERELARYRAGHDIGVSGVSPPGARVAALGGVLPENLPAISDEIRRTAKLYGERFKAMIGAAEPIPAAVEPEPIAEAVEDNPATLAAGAPVAAVIPAAEAAAVEPYEPGSPEYESYQAALAETTSAAARPVTEEANV